MQTFMTSADKTHSVSRPDPADRARSPADSRQADPNGTPFGKIYHAAPSRSSEVETSGPAGSRAGNVNAPDGEAHGEAHAQAHDREDQYGSAFADSSGAPRDPATRADITQDTTAEPDNTRAGDPTDADPSSPRTLSDGDPIGDATDPDTQAKTMLDGDAATRSEAADPSHPGPAVARGLANPAGVASPDVAGQRPSHGTIPPDAAHMSRAGAGERVPDRLPADVAAPSLVASASTRSDRAKGTALPDLLSLARSVEGTRTGRDAETAASRVPMTRGQDDARLSVPTAAPALANTISPPVMQGHGAGSLPSTRAVTALFAGSPGTDGAERGRDPDMPLGPELRGTSGSSPGSATLATPPRSDLPQTIAMQIAAAIQKGGPGMKPGIELRLSPEELGAVRLTFVQSETGVTVNVQAERTETLELLRRNIDSLAQEFLDIGYDSAKFTFGDRDSDPQSATHTIGMAGPETDGEADAPRAIDPTLLISDRLDIRL